MNCKMNYKLISTKGTRTITGTEHEAIQAAIAMESELQPSFGVTVELDGATVAEIRDGEVEEALYGLIRWGSESQEGYAPAYCRVCGATLSTFDKTAPIGEQLRWHGCAHIEAARKFRAASLRN